MIIIVGGGIAGLSMALTCQQLGLDCRVFEAATKIEALGVGINLQPNAVRELYDLGLADDLAAIGIEAEEWALFATGGKLVWSEPRGRLAGYNWPQFSVHRGALQMMLLDAIIERLGEDVVICDAQLTAYTNTPSGITAEFVRANGQTFKAEGELLVGADGINSSVRRQMYPEEGAPQWGGAIMWRGTSLASPPRTGNSFILMGTLDQRFVCYPISKPNADGLTTLNWIAELTPTRTQQPVPTDWNRQVNKDQFLPEFLSWCFDWIDVPQIIRGAEEVFEYPMVDRDPVPTWIDGRVLIIGDAAHAMYPVGSNGASQAIVDTRVLGACLKTTGVSAGALKAYETRMIEDLNALVLRNRGAGPIGVLGVVEQRSGGEFENISEVIDHQELAEYMASYKRAAGFAIDTLNHAPPTLLAD